MSFFSRCRDKFKFSKLKLEMIFISVKHVCSFENVTKYVMSYNCSALSHILA